MSNLVVITGANRGIGLALVDECLSRGDTVIGTCRQSSKDLNSSGAEVVEGVDVNDFSSILNFKKMLGDRVIDVLINNAGILGNEDLENIDYDSVHKQFEINAVAPLKITEALLSNLGAGSKVAMITSRMGSIGGNTSGGYYGYRMSKAALNCATMSLSHDLASRGIAVAALHPGFVKTDMVNHAGDMEASVAASGLIDRIEELSLDNSGGFWHSTGEELVW